MPRTIVVMERSELLEEDNNLLQDLLDDEQIDITYEGNGNTLLFRTQSWIEEGKAVCLYECIGIPAGVDAILI